MTSEADKPQLEEPTKHSPKGPIAFSTFLESVSPSQSRPIVDLWKPAKYWPALETPDVTLHCDDETCGGGRIFRVERDDVSFQNPVLNVFLTYICSNCRQTKKRFSLLCIRGEDNGGTAYKYGENPSFGPATPARLIRLFGGDKDLFLKGRRCESQGLGIGAFTYYRRVVESHKDQIFDAIVRVATTVGLAQEKIDAIINAKSEHQFSKAVSSVKDALPQTLLIKGQNPLTLLHDALSGGIHSKTDADCLSFAQDVRIVLVELAEKISSALNDDAELSAAVNRLVKSRQK